MTEEVAAKVEVFVADPMFDPVAMLRVSQAAATICKWVKAMDSFQKGRKVSGRPVEGPTSTAKPAGQFLGGGAVNTSPN